MGSFYMLGRLLAHRPYVADVVRDLKNEALGVYRTLKEDNNPELRSLVHDLISLNATIEFHRLLEMSVVHALGASDQAVSALSMDVATEFAASAAKEAEVTFGRCTALTNSLSTPIALESMIRLFRERNDVGQRALTMLEANRGEWLLLQNIIHIPI